MADEQRDAATVRFPPPLVYLSAVILGTLLHVYVLPFRYGFGLGARITAGAAIALLGTAVMGGAIGLFRRTGQDPKPWKTTPEIISTGVYRVTRNPMYLGMLMMLMALAIYMGSLPFYVATLTLFIILNAAFCPYEEQKLVLFAC